jgi:hypothetical protein
VPAAPDPHYRHDAAHHGRGGEATRRLRDDLHTLREKAQCLDQLRVRHRHHLLDQTLDDRERV